MKRFFNGFTLSEVLITLGVIGVVAAMTLPTLIQKQQKMIWTNQLKKSYSILNQGFQKMLADEGVDLLSQTSVFNSIGGTGTSRDCSDSNATTDVKCSEFYKNLGKYFKIVEIKKFENSDNYVVSTLRNSTYFNPYTQRAIILSDGTTIFEYYFMNYAQGYKNGVAKGFVSKFTMDVNGIKGPNKLGRDVFIFILGENGLVYPYSSRISSEIWCSGSQEFCYWRNIGNCENNGSSYGEGCAARIMDNGWKMDY